jgi:hypothetical protein
VSSRPDIERKILEIKLVHTSNKITTETQF